MHQKQLHEDNSFITCTYKTLPPGGTLIPEDFTKFLKRLRKRRPPRSVRYLMCGEYGDEKRRPHYHALLFGVRFPDQQPYGTSADGSLLYTSAELADLWPSGFSTVGEVTFESAAYVARYAMKKLSFYGERAYEHLDLETGEVLKLKPEYVRMSLKPAIGKEWFSQYKTDVYPSDEVIMRGKPMKPPKYYDKLLEEENPDELLRLKLQRLGDALERAHDSTTRRLAEREEVKIAQTQNLRRNLE